MNNIIDFHCHIYPEKIAAKAVKAIGDFYNLDMDKKGTADDLIETSRKSGITNMIVHSTATSPHQVEAINTFIIGETKKHPEFIGFGTLHPDFGNTEDEIKRMIDAGLKGIKIHPDFQAVNIDDERMYKIYEILDARLPILFHIGDKTKDFSNPLRLKKMLKCFPSQKVIAAHFGGYSMWNEALEILRNTDVFVDTCSSFAFLSDKEILHYINAYTEDRVLFASDYPMWDVGKEKERLLSLGLRTDTLEKIFHLNAEGLIYTEKKVLNNEPCKCV